MTDFATHQGILLIPDHPLQVLPALAVELGLNEAIAVQQLHYWTTRSEDKEGWVYNTMEEWLEQFPFWSKRTVERVWKSLAKKRLVEVKQRGGTDRTNHYRLVYEQLPKYRFPTRQSGGMVPPDGRDADAQNGGLSSSKQETTQRTPLPPKGGRRRKKVNRKPVTDAEHSLATEIVGAFNEAAGTSYTADAHLVSIVGRIREHPELDAREHRKLIARAFAKPWWDGHPAPNVIYGNAGIFEKAIEEARGKTAGKSSPKGVGTLKKLAERDA